MKIIEAMKKIKDLQRKCDDLKDKVKAYCADLDCETATYPDQRRQISEWLQSHSDICKEISHLRLSITKTNVETQVTIMIDNRAVTKSICEWIHRRKDLANSEEAMWRGLTDKNLKEDYKTKLTPNAPETVVKRRLYFDPVERDKKVALYRSEPFLIDAALEVTNATTDLVKV
jgi:hypothetical protein